MKRYRVKPDACLSLKDHDPDETGDYKKNGADKDAAKEETEKMVLKLGRLQDRLYANGSKALLIVLQGMDTSGKDGTIKHAAKYWTPNGNHRLSAMRTLGAKTIVAIVVPQATAAYQILALNTEKAHNLREKALEVIRMYRELAQLEEAGEETYALEFEEPALITLGLCYEERPRFSGGAYHPVLKRVEEFLKKPLRTAIESRQDRARKVLALDDAIVKQVEGLKAKGLTSPYLKNFVVARVNPLRFRPKDAPVLSFDDALERMMQAASKFNPDKIKIDDLAKSGGAPDEVE